jgi:beta-galactosidase/beta-glucuronidase
MVGSFIWATLRTPRQPPLATHRGPRRIFRIYVNGALAITHLGGYTPFVIDITGSLSSGAATVIAVRLDNNSSESFPPGNTNPDFLYFGGLYRDAYLHVTDSLHVTNAIYSNTPPRQRCRSKRTC